MTQTKCLVLGSCTGQKDDHGCPEEMKLQEVDFSSASRLMRAERKVKSWLRPAGAMYRGRQHSLMMEGVKRLRIGFSKASFDVAIVSAGYGLLSENRQIAPYNITFQGKGLHWARKQGVALGIPEAMRTLIPQYEVIFFLLGKEYLCSLGAPPSPLPGQKLVYFGAGVERFYPPTNKLLVVPAAQKEASQYGGAGVTGIKGRMFALFAQEIVDSPHRWKGFLEDPTSKTLVDIMNASKKAH